MKRYIYISGIVFLVIALITIAFISKEYNKPHADIHNSEPDLILTAETLINDFSQEEEKANKKYLDKLIQVEGVIKEISTANGNSTITMGTPNSLKNIICTMEPAENKKTFGISEGQRITIKGICTGFLMDVILVRSVIVN